MNKLFFLVGLWFFIGVAYLIMAVMMPATRELVSTAAAAIDASANMSLQPGTLGMVESSPVWFWVVPGFVGIVATVVTLRKGEKR